MRRFSFRTVFSPLILASVLCSVGVSPGSARAQVATYELVPLPAPHWNPFPEWIRPLNTPRIGSTFELAAPGLLYGCHCYPSYFLLTGFSNPRFDMRQLGPQFSGLLMTSSAFVLGREATRGPQAVIDMPIPSDPRLVGFEFFQQVAYFFESPTYGSSVLLGTAGHGVVGL